jgi:predicted RNA methylase
MAAMTDVPPRAGYTPGTKAVPEVLARYLGASAAAEKSARAWRSCLLRAPAPTAAAVAELLPNAVRPARGALAALLGPLAALGAQGATESLLALVRDGDLKTQLAAINGLGRLRGEARVEAALLALLATGPRREVQQALVRALGKAGGAAAAAVLAPAAPPDASAGSGLGRELERARLILARETTRGEPSRIRDEAPMPGAIPVRLYCRRGLEELLAAEAAGLGFATRLEAAGCLLVVTAAPLRRLMELRLLERLAFPLTLPLPPAADTTDAAVPEALARPATLALLRALTEGALRLRIDFPGASRSRIWALGARLQSAAPELINDPTASTWEVGVLSAGGATQIELRPKRLADQRFAYRKEFVPAASHPTLAAALARLAGAEPTDVVWDPYTGSGTELIERSRLGPAARLVGTDLDAKALAAARANLEAAGVSAVELFQRDCLAVKGLKPSLILTNPPMGRRVQRGNLVPLHDAFLEHVAAELAPDGRLVWISPLPERSAQALARHGMELVYRQAVDMGGFTAELQVARRLI